MDYELEFAKLDPEEKEGNMELISSWEKRGMEYVVLRLLRQRLGDLPVEVEQRIDGLSPEQIGALTDTLFDIQSVDQVTAWLSRQSSQ